MTEQRASAPSGQEILLTVSIPSDYLPQAAEMITQNGGRFAEGSPFLVTIETGYPSS